MLSKQRQAWNFMMRLGRSRSDLTLMISSMVVFFSQEVIEVKGKGSMLPWFPEGEV
jgi:hypothetical protein